MAHNLPECITVGGASCRPYTYASNMCGEMSEIMLSLQQQLQASIPLSPLLHT